MSKRRNHRKSRSDSHKSSKVDRKQRTANTSTLRGQVIVGLIVGVMVALAGGITNHLPFMYDYISGRLDRKASKLVAGGLSIDCANSPTRLAVLAPVLRQFPGYKPHIFVISVLNTGTGVATEVRSYVKVGEGFIIGCSYAPDFIQPLKREYESIDDWQIFQNKLHECTIEIKELSPGVGYYFSVLCVVPEYMTEESLRYSVLIFDADGPAAPDAYSTIEHPKVRESMGVVQNASF